MPTTRVGVQAVTGSAGQVVDIDPARISATITNAGAEAIEYSTGSGWASIAVSGSATVSCNTNALRLRRAAAGGYPVPVDIAWTAQSEGEENSLTAAQAASVSGAGPDGGITIGSTTFYPIADMTAAQMLALSPATYQGRVVRVTDLNRALFESNGTRWKPVNGRAVIATQDTDWTGVTGTAEQIAFQRLIPAGIVSRQGDTLIITGSFGKSSTSETTTIQLRLGAAGTTADTSILTTAPLAAANVSHGMWLEFTRDGATSIKRSLNGATQNPLGASSSALAPATTLASSLDSVAQYLTVTMTQSSTAETPTLRRFRVELVTAAA